MKRRQLLQSALALGAVAALPRLAAQTRDTVPVRITLPSAGSAGSVWRPVLEKLDLPEESGLNLQWVTADPGRMQTQLAAGSLDIGVFGAIGLSTLVNRGGDITLFGPALNNHGRWIVPGDSPFTSPRDLVGRTIATTPETSETYQQARITASLIGIDLKSDLKVIHGAPTANLALLERGDVDAIITLEPTATRLVGRGYKELARVADLWKEATGSTEDPFLVGLAASNQWLDAHPETARQVAALFASLNGAIRQRPELLREVHADIGIRENETRAIELLPERAADSYATAWDDKVFAVIDKQIEIAHQLELLPQVPSRKIYRRI